jgi:hypothetical protein
MAKHQYRVRNWKDYNRSLEERGSIEIWIDEEILSSKRPKIGKGKRGRPIEYASGLIECALAVRYIHNLPFRQTEGFLRSMLGKIKPSKKVPDYTTVCKRQQKLDVKILKKCKKSRRKLFFLVDSSGLKISGEGEWKVRQHGYSKRRTWRKLHIGVGIVSNGNIRIEAVKLTDKNVADVKIFPDLLKQVEGKIEKSIGDGAYDSASCYKVAKERGSKFVAPPRCKAKTQFAKALKSTAIKERNKNIRVVHKFGMEYWKKKTNYHQRSLVENMFFRFKTIFGSTLASHKFENQRIEAMLKCQILNRMSEFGMPKSYAVV